MEAGSYCRTLKCLWWDLLQKRFFGLPSTLFPPNASCHRSFVVFTPCPQTCGQCWVGASMAGSGQAETARETTSEQGQPPQPPWKPQPSLANTRGPCTAPVLSRAPFPSPLWAAWSRHQGHTSVLMVLVPLWSLSSLMPPSMALASIQPGWTPASNVEKSWRALPHVSAPHRIPQLFQSGGSAGPLSPLPLHPCASPSRRCCSRAGSFLHRHEAEDSLQTKDSAAATWSPCHDHCDTCWCCHFRHGQTVKLLLHGTAHFVPIFPPITGQGHH